MANFDSSNRGLFVLFAIAVSPYLCNGYINSLIADNALQYWAFELATWVLLPAPESGLWKVMTALYFSLSAGFVEEAIYRGFAFNIFSRISSSALPFLLFSPLIFAAVHWEGGLANVAASWVFGLLAAVAWLLLRNIWPLVVGHVFTDYVWFG